MHQICTINPEFVVLAQSQAEFFQVLQKSAVNVLDGWGAVWALRWRGIAVPGRVTGSDGLPLLAQAAAQHGWRLFFLGAGEGIAQQAADILTARYPGLQVVGTYSGSPDPSDANFILEQLRQSEADILLVAYGAPAQDLWIARYQAQLSVKVAMGVGGSFDFITEHIPRAPHWMRRSGLEWLFRLYQQPWRWRRMLRLPLFVWWAWRYGEHRVPGQGT
jgi:N-acetylglucosaminyldiphosphoundecaprenol N-acetyl-beta-D-mannosaminyltransferase